MKLDTSKPVNVVTSSSPAIETIACGFDPQGTSHLMRLLSNLYKDAASSVLREYSTNAYDSHIAAGNTDPIEVTLPTVLKPNLVITDHGTGLSRDEMIEVYARYGASTKRESNDQVGAFGLGAKSAFTLGTQFIVTAVKNKWCTVAMFSLDSKGVATVSILSHDPTEDRNGVTVSISVEKPGDMIQAARNVFFAWPKGSVLVDGKSPRSIFDNPLNVTDSILLADNPYGERLRYGQDRLVIVMGNISYPVTQDLISKLYRDLNQVSLSTTNVTYAIVDVGDVDIAPSREAMRDTPKTLDRIRQVLRDYNTGVVALINKELDDCPTASAAARKVSTLTNKWGLRSPRQFPFMWHKEALPSAIRLPHPGVVYTSYDRCSRHYHGYQLFLGNKELDTLKVVTDVPKDKVETAMRWVRSYFAGQRGPLTLIFVPPGTKQNNWFEFGKPDTFPSVTFTEFLAKAKENREKESSLAPEAPAKGYELPYRTRTSTEGRKKTPTQIAATNLNVLTIKATDYPSLSESFLKRILEGHIIVILDSGMTAKALQRKLGKKVTVTDLHDRIKAVATEVIETATPEAISATRTPVVIRHKLMTLRDQLTNPAVTAVLDADITGLPEVWSSAPGLFPEGAGLENKFPLLRAISQVPDSPLLDAHLISYLNKVPRKNSKNTNTKGK